MERVNLFFLHGFLGRPDDWSAVHAQLPRHEGWKIFTPDYFKDTALSPQHDFAAWSGNFINWVQQQTHPQDKNILVGYSLGGRLALHALEKQTDLWHKVVLVSTNPGFNDSFAAFTEESEDRRQRWMNDTYWAEEFMKAPWDMVLRNWNAQPVFGGSETEPARKESDYSREVLNLALTQWSLAQQKNMRGLLAENAQKIIWMVGERDEKFLLMSEKLQNDIQNLCVDIAPNSSHRVLFDNPSHVSECLRDLLYKL